MRYSHYIGVLAGCVVIASAFFPWVYIPALDVKVSGIYGELPKFGKPALMNIYVTIINFLFFLLPYVWMKRFNPFVGAVNFAWALRNFLLLSICRENICPEKYPAIYVYMIATFIVLLMTLFPSTKLKENS